MGRVAVIVAAFACAAALAPGALAYNWPLRPFDAQHPVRGNFNDPRIAPSPDGMSESFHFGIDISAPDYTWVYSVSKGRAVTRGNTVRVRMRVRGVMHEYAYWHIWPFVDTGDTIRLHQRLGQIAPGYLHVHFAEVLAGRIVNPLRRGALAPYVDRTAPVVAGATFATEDGAAESPSAVSGVVDLLASVYDLPPIAPPPPWNAVKLSPATISWRIVQGTVEMMPWDLAVDFGGTLLPRSLFTDVYAPGTKQNKKLRPGNLVFYLQHEFDTHALVNGPYELEITASDTRGNTGSARVPFTVAN